MRLLSCLIVLSLLVACVPTESQLRMEKDLEVMKRRLNQLEIQKAEAAGTSQADGDALQRQLAEVVAGLDNLRVEFQSVNGRLDDMGQNNQQLADDLRLTKEDLGLQLADVVNRVEKLEVAREQQPVPPVAPVEQPKPVAETAEQLYQRALDKIRKDDEFAAGRKLLEEFIGKYPKHDLYVNALYWSGEALYGEKKYELAILQLQDVISKHSGHPKAAAAMLKQALAFNALGDSQNAQTTMQKLVDDYPNSPQAESAQKYLQK